MSHYYDKDCNPCHTVIGKNGKERKTTIADARKNSYFPSVTTVLDILDKPQLSTWKLQQVANACYENPSIQGGNYIATPEAYAAQMIEKAFEQVKDAADIGTAIHDAIECFIKGEERKQDTVSMPDGTEVKLSQVVKDVMRCLDEHNIEIEHSELRIANLEMGYAGTTDAAITINGKKGILDFKTRKTNPKYKCKPYDTEPAQIAAYHLAYYGEIADDAVGCNVYISTTEIGRIEPVFYDAETLIQQWGLFQSALAIWKIQKQYDPGAAS